MATGRGFAGKRLPLTVAFAVLLVAAFGAGCKNFFQDPTLSSVSIQPTKPQVNVGQTLTLQAWGTYSDNSRKQIKSGVSWSVDPAGIATITGTGTATLEGIAPGSVTVSVSAQALGGTADATVIGDVTKIGVSPTSGSLTIGGTGEAFTFTGSPGPPNFITVDNGGILTISPSDSFFTCAVGVDGSNNPAEVCSATQGAVASYTIVMSYPDQSGGTVSSQTVTIAVSP
jgi:Bacterial Ig-like domain (group 2)